jgi:type II secretory pathway component PulC
MALNLKKNIPLFIIAMLTAGGIVVWFTLPTSQRKHSLPSPPIEEIDEALLEDITPVTDAGQHRPDPQVILQRHLFGKPQDDKKNAPETPAPVQLTVTSLDLSLLGTITGEPANRRAVILDKKKKGQEIYGQGDKIQGSQIKEIQRDKIILTVNGKDEVLLPETPKKNVPSRPPSFQPAQTATEPPAVVDNADTPDAEPLEPESLEPPGEAPEAIESAESPPNDTLEPMGKETGNLPPVRSNPQKPSINKYNQEKP